MYPLLIEFEKDFEGMENPLLFIAENMGNSVVKNGEFSGQNTAIVIGEFGKEALGESGKNSALFGNYYELELLKSNLKSHTTETNPDDAVIYPFGVVNEIINNDEMTACSLSLNGRTGIYEENSFLIALITENDCLISDFDSTVKAKKGSCVFIPAKTRIELTGEAEIILIHR